MSKQPVGVMESLKPRMFFIRGQKVMLDEDLAALYKLDTEALNQAAARNIERFPEGAVFQLNPEELAGLKSRITISDRTAPYVYTGQGLALLSGILFDEWEICSDEESCPPTCACRM